MDAPRGATRKRVHSRVERPMHATSSWPGNTSDTLASTRIRTTLPWRTRGELYWQRERPDRCVRSRVSYTRGA